MKKDLAGGERRPVLRISSAFSAVLAACLSRTAAAAALFSAAFFAANASLFFVFSFASASIFSAFACMYQTHRYGFKWDLLLSYEF